MAKVVKLRIYLKYQIFGNLKISEFNLKKSSKCYFCVIMLLTETKGDKKMSKTVMQTQLEELALASIVARQNTIIVSPPGWGKSKMSYNIAKQAVGSDKVVFTPLDPSTPPEAIKGAVDIESLKKGKLEFNVTGTPSDKNARVVILDEVGRPNMVVFDMLLHITNDVTSNERETVFWGTANFLPNQERTEALIDRFALYCFATPEPVDVDVLVNSQPMHEWTFDVPSFDDEKVQMARTAKMTPKSAVAVSKAIKLLINAIGKEKFTVNPRRVEAWREILFRLSVYYYGTTDFSSCHEKALRALRYAYPAVDEDTYRKWQGIASTIVDALKTAIEQCMANTRQKFNKVINSSGENKAALIPELSLALAQAQAELERFGEDNPQVIEALQQYDEMFKKACQGKQVD